MSLIYYQYKKITCYKNYNVEHKKLQKKKIDHKKLHKEKLTIKLQLKDNCHLYNLSLKKIIMDALMGHQCNYT